MLVFLYLPFDNGQEIDLSHKNEAMDLLITFFSKGYKKDKIETLENVFHLNLSDEDLGRVREMSNLGQSMIDYGVKQGIAQGMAQDMAQGMAQGMAQVTLLHKYLTQQKRFGDLERSFEDPAYQQELLIELAPYYKK